jgi:hypothetical protein
MKKDSIVASDLGLGLRRKSKTIDLNADKGILTTQDDID